MQPLLSSHSLARLKKHASPLKTYTAPASSALLSAWPPAPNTALLDSSGAPTTAVLPSNATAVPNVSLASVLDAFKYALCNQEVPERLNRYAAPAAGCEWSVWSPPTPTEPPDSALAPMRIQSFLIATADPNWSPP